MILLNPINKPRVFYYNIDVAYQTNYLDEDMFYEEDEDYDDEIFYDDEEDGFYKKHYEEDIEDIEEYEE